MIMAHGDLRFCSTKETTNYARLCRLLIDVGTQVLRETFDRLRPCPGESLHLVLRSPSVYSILNSLRKRRVLNPIQWGRLYPVIRTNVSSGDFDITLLTLLLRNICNLVPPATGWNSLPCAAETSTAADIVRLKAFRNRIYGHAANASIDDPTFHQLWQDIKETLLRLGGEHFARTIDDLKYECMDPDFGEFYRELIEEWVKDEMTIKESLDKIEKRLESLVLDWNLERRRSEMEAEQPRSVVSVEKGKPSSDRSVQDHEFSQISPQGNPGNEVSSTAVGNTNVNAFMKATTNQLGSGVISTLFAGANIGTVQVGSLNVYQGNVKLVHGDENKQITDSDKKD